LLGIQFKLLSGNDVADNGESNAGKAMRWETEKVGIIEFLYNNKPILARLPHKIHQRDIQLTS